MARKITSHSMNVPSPEGCFRRPPPFASIRLCTIGSDRMNGPHRSSGNQSSQVFTVVSRNSL